MSIIENEYNNANFKGKSVPTFFSDIKVSYIDVLANREVEVRGKDYKECLCKNSAHIHEYFKECDKCSGSGIITLNGRSVVCNECEGNKYIRVRDCYLCHNKSKLLLESLIKIKLNDTYKDGEEIVVDKCDYKLCLKLNIYDKDDYFIEGNNVYYLRLIDYSKSDYKENKSIVINTVKGKEYVKSEFKRKKEIVCLKNNGIEDGNFYFTFNNEVNNEKEIIYSNVIIDESGYVSESSLVNDSYSVVSKYVPVSYNDYVFIDKEDNVIENNEYEIHLNKLSSKHFKEDNKNIVYDLYLDKEDMDSDKKSIEINEEKINVSYKKNFKDIQYVNVVNKCLVDKKGKKTTLTIRVNPCFENVYKIRIKKNNGNVYIEDYKRIDNRLVETFKSSKYLDEYICVNDEDKLVVGNDLILIERV